MYDTFRYFEGFARHFSQVYRHFLFRFDVTHDIPKSLMMLGIKISESQVTLVIL